MLKDLEKQYGAERFPGILTLAFFEAFWGALSERIPALPLYAFLPEETESNRLQVIPCGGWACASRKDAFCVSVQDLLCASALSGIPLLISGGGNAHDLAEDFLRVLFEAPPLSRLPVSQEDAAETRPLPSAAPLLLDAEELSAPDLKTLARLEKGTAPGGTVFPAVFIVDDGFDAEQRTPLQKKFLSISIPRLPAGGAPVFSLEKSGAAGFDAFVEDLMELASQYLEVEKQELQDLRGRWPACYSAIAGYTFDNPAYTDTALEWFHLTAKALKGDHKRTAVQEAWVLMEWMEQFDMRGLVTLPELERWTCMDPLGDLFQGPGSLNPADVGRIYGLAPFFATLGRIRFSLSSPGSLESYFENSAPVSIRDLFISFHIILSEYPGVDSMDLASALNGMAESYREIRDSMATLLGPEEGTACNPEEISIRSRVINLAIREGLEHGGGVDPLLQFLLKTAKRMVNIFHPEPRAVNLPLLLLMTDIFTIAGFLHYYRKELSLIVNCFDRESSIGEVIAGLRRFFLEKKKTEALTIPSIFLQRIPEILCRDFW